MIKAEKKNHKKLIGVFIGEASKPVQRELIRGIAKEALPHNINVAVFSTLVRDGGYEDFKAGEALVYDIAQLNKLDACIIFPETLRIKDGILETICDRIRKCDKPLKLSYDTEIEGFKTFC